MDANLLIRRLNLTANHVLREEDAPPLQEIQLDLFSQPENTADTQALEREKKRQKALLTIKKKFGKNAILKGMNLQDGATAKDRNAQIGGHKA